MLTLPQQVDDEIELHPFEAIHSAALFALVNEGRGYLRRWQNWPDRIHSLKDMQALIQHSQRKRKHKNGIDLVIVYRGQVAGKIGLVYIDWRMKMAEIGYWLGEGYQGRGLMTRCTRAIVHYAFFRLQLERVVIRCALGNTRSSAIPKRLAFSYEGVHPQKVWLHGQYHDEAVYAMTRKKWRQQMIYHITTRQGWQQAQKQGEYRAASLTTQGFIHLSRLEQVTRVADAIYRGQKGLLLLCVDPALLTAELRYENPDPAIPAPHEDAETFPHLYGPLPLQAVVRVVELPPRPDGGFTLPEDL